MLNFLGEIVKRSITGIFFVGVVAGSYMHSQLLFSIFIAIAYLIIIFDEMPRLFPPKNFLLASIALFYPLFPMIGLFSLHHIFYVKDFFLTAYVFLIACTADTTAYVVGKSIGHIKLCPILSPGKTLEGLIGGLIGVFIVNSLVLQKIVTAPFYFIGTHFIIRIFYSILVTLAAFLGGLMLSWLKRRQNIKDAGSLLPGHGGLLDRFDSIFGVVVVVWAVLIAKNMGYF